ncbi:MAG TPA: prephenate dehydrogenase/arogenate dehydrogenase family protein [Solirubrobacteraceae bacterium]|nr:prephenate dehydrogenase/arogenate dehydrogenase family protein [Solirubrobacteraceae bacterium]
MRVAVVGLGLIGGSIALAARERLDAEVRGWDPDPTAVAAAVRRGALASGAGSLADAVAGADVVVTAAPVTALPQVLAEVLAVAAADAAVTDVGSTKGTIVAGVDDPRFVGGHPLAGAETSGAENASPDLFEGSLWYLAPGAGTAQRTVDRVERLVQALGAIPARVDAAGHDRLMAAVSHLPHVFANVLVAHALQAGAQGASGPSFRDATRVAGANPAVWGAIFLDNRRAVAEAIADAVARLDAFRSELERGDAEAIARWCERAAADRERLGR